MSDQTEVEVTIEAAVVDERPDFETLLNTHYKALLAFATRLTGNRSRAEDIIQDAFERAWKAWPRWRPLPDMDPESYAKAWLYRIVSNVFLNTNQANVTRSKMTSAYLEETLSSEAPRRADDTLGHVEFSAYVLDAISMLQPDFRDTVLRFYIQEQGHAQIAKELGVCKGTIMSRLSRSRGMLKPLLEAMAQELGYLGSTRENTATFESPKAEQTDADRVDAVVGLDHIRPLRGR